MSEISSPDQQYADNLVNEDEANNYESLNEKSLNFIKTNSDSGDNDGDTDSINSNVSINNLDLTTNSEEEEEKLRLIERVLELQSTLEDLSKKVTEVKEENIKLKSENNILGNYIENLMATSGVFQSTWQKKTSTNKPIKE